MRLRLSAVFVVIAMIAGACGSEATSTATPQPDALALADDPTTTTAAPTTSTTTSTSAAPTTTTTTSTIAPDPTRTWVATALDHVTRLTPSVEPDGALFAMPWFQPNPHQFGTPLTLMVTEGQPGDDWVKVQLPIRPNGQEAWVSTEDYEISAVFTRAEVNLTSQQVRVWENGELIAKPTRLLEDRRPRLPSAVSMLQPRWTITSVSLRSCCRRSLRRWKPLVVLFR